MAKRRSRGSRVSRKRSKVSRKRSKVSRKRSKVSRKRSRVSRKRSRISRKNRTRVGGGDPPDPRTLARTLFAHANLNVLPRGETAMQFFRERSDPTKSYENMLGLFDYILENIEGERWDQVSIFLPVVMKPFRGSSSDKPTRPLKKVFNQIVMAVNYYAPGGEGGGTYPGQNIKQIDGIPFYNERDEMGMHTR